MHDIIHAEWMVNDVEFVEEITHEPGQVFEWVAYNSKSRVAFATGYDVVEYIATEDGTWIMAYARVTGTPDVDPVTAVLALGCHPDATVGIIRNNGIVVAIYYPTYDAVEG